MSATEDQPTEEIADVSNAASSSSSDEAPPSPRTVIPAARVRSAASSHAGLPLAVSILSQPGLLLSVPDATRLVPPMFARYDGPGGELIRSRYYAMLAEYKANAEDGFMAHGNIKCALFVAFIDLCCAFTPEPSEEACLIIVELVDAFMKNIRALLKMDMRAGEYDYATAGSPMPTDRQLALLVRLFPELYDTRAFETEALPLLDVHLKKRGDAAMNMYIILHEYATVRGTAFFTHAQHVRDQILAATHARYMYVANIFLRYFIFTLTAVCRLAPKDWETARTLIPSSSGEHAINYFKCKIDSHLRSNFDDLRAYMLSKQFLVEANLTAEYKRNVENRDAPPHDDDAKLRVQMDIPVDDAAHTQNSSVCLIL